MPGRWCLPCNRDRPWVRFVDSAASRGNVHRELWNMRRAWIKSGSRTHEAMAGTSRRMQALVLVREPETQHPCGAIVDPHGCARREWRRPRFVARSHSEMARIGTKGCQILGYGDRAGQAGRERGHAGGTWQTRRRQMTGKQERRKVRTVTRVSSRAASSSHRAGRETGQRLASPVPRRS